MLDENKVVYKNLNVASDKAAREEMLNKTGQFAVPAVDIDGEVVVGYDANWLKQKLNL